VVVSELCSRRYGLRYRFSARRDASGRAWEGVNVRKAGEQDHGEVPISRRYCLSVSMNFVKHGGQ